MDKQAAFASNATISNTYLSRTSLKNLQVTHEVEIPGSGMYILGDEKYLYTATKVEKERGISITILHRDDLQTVKKFEIPDASHIIDALEIDKKIYFLILTDDKDNSSKDLVVYDTKEKSIQKIKLPFDQGSKLHYYGGQLYIVQYGFHGQPTENSVGIMNLKSKNIKLINFSTAHRTSYIENNQFISSDGEYIYEYDLSDFKLQKKIELDAQEDLLYATFFIKQSLSYKN